jgi:hypothetical protein
VMMMIRFVVGWPTRECMHNLVVGV